MTRPRRKPSPLQQAHSSSREAASLLSSYLKKYPDPSLEGALVALRVQTRVLREARGILARAGVGL